MNQTRTRNPFITAFFVLACVVGLAAAYTSTENDDTRKVSFYGAVGDSKSWAGGFTMTVTVNARSTPYHVAALPKDSTAINTYLLTKKVKVGSAVGCLITADWPGKVVKAQLRGFGVDTRPAVTTSPQQPYASAVVK